MPPKRREEKNSTFIKKKKVKRSTNFRFLQKIAYYVVSSPFYIKENICIYIFFSDLLFFRPCFPRSSARRLVVHYSKLFDPSCREFNKADPPANKTLYIANIISDVWRDVTLRSAHSINQELCFSARLVPNFSVDSFDGASNL